MRVIKNINNNVAICLDSRGQEVVAFGKGIGFAKPPYDIDIARVQRTFYDIDPVYIDSVQHIPEEMLEVATKVIDFARTRVGYLMNSSVVFTLADHLAFTVKRFQGHMHLDMPLYHDVRVLYEEETEIGEYALRLIDQRFGIRLPKEEATGIALHLVNAGAAPRTQTGAPGNATVIEHICGIVEGVLGFHIDDRSQNYARFVLHLQYLIKRGDRDEEGTATDTSALMEPLRAQYPRIYLCAVQIVEYLHGIYGTSFGEDEELYLMLHLNRLREHTEPAAGEGKAASDASASGASSCADPAARFGASPSDDSTARPERP